jgi:hypothetical protein
LSRAFDEHGHELASKTPPIERVARIYMRDGQEVLDITFQGNERNSLADSMELVCSFFEQLANREE